jgi:hypothetical protein
MEQHWRIAFDTLMSVIEKIGDSDSVAIAHDAQTIAEKIDDENIERLIQSFEQGGMSRAPEDMIREAEESGQEVSTF